MGHGDGFIVLARSIRDSWVWRLQPAHLKVWLQLLLDARWARDEEKVVLPGESVLVRRGQVWTTYRTLAKRAGVGVQVARTALRLFSQDGAISTHQVGRYGTVITITNYEGYQDGQASTNTPANTLPTHLQHTSNTITTRGTRTTKGTRKQGDLVARPAPPAVFTLDRPGLFRLPITQSKLDEWAEAYPGVRDPMDLLRRAQQWCLDNRPRGPRSRARALSWLSGAWFKREHLEAMDGAAPHSAVPEAPPSASGALFEWIAERHKVREPRALSAWCAQWVQANHLRLDAALSESTLDRALAEWRGRPGAE